MLSQGVVDMVANLTRERDAYKAKAEALREILEVLVHAHERAEEDKTTEVWWNEARTKIKGTPWP